LPSEYEMDKIMFSNELPDKLTFPEAYKLYFEIVKKYLKINNHN